MSSVSPFHSLTWVLPPLLGTVLGTKAGMEMLDVKLPGQGVFKEGADSPWHCSSAPAGTQQVSSSHLSPSQQCRPPYLSPSFQGQAKLFLLAVQHEGWAPLIMMMTLAIYLPASWRLECPPPLPLPDPSLPQAFPCLLLSALVTGWVFSPALGPP